VLIRDLHNSATLIFAYLYYTILHNKDFGSLYRSTSVGTETQKTTTSWQSNWDVEIMNAQRILDGKTL
jgi:hypothetical protein